MQPELGRQAFRGQVGRRKAASGVVNWETEAMRGRERARHASAARQSCRQSCRRVGCRLQVESCRLASNALGQLATCNLQLAASSQPAKNLDYCSAEDLDTWNCTKTGHSGSPSPHRLPPLSPPFFVPYRENPVQEAQDLWMLTRLRWPGQARSDVPST